MWNDNNRELRGNHGCKVKLKVLDDNILGRLHDPTHALDGSNEEILKVAIGINPKAEETLETP